MSEAEHILHSRQIRDLMQAGAREGLAEAALLIGKKAAEMAPPSPAPDVDPDPTITLRDTMKIEVEGINVVVVGFHTKYAARIHEDVRAKHPKGGKAKYLEDALKEVLPELTHVIGGPIHLRMTSRGGAPRAS